jgi:hypothetical protein
MCIWDQINDLLLLLLLLLSTQLELMRALTTVLQMKSYFPFCHTNRQNPPTPLVVAG